MKLVYVKYKESVNVVAEMSFDEAVSEKSPGEDTVVGFLLSQTPTHLCLSGWRTAWGTYAHNFCIPLECVVEQTVLPK